MLDRPFAGSFASHAASQPASAADLIGLNEIIAFARRRRIPIIASVLAFFLAGLAYLLVTPAEYTSQASLLIDTRKLSIFDEGNVFEESAPSAGTVETQVQLLQSGEIIRATIQRLGPLAEDPALVGDNTRSLFDELKSFIKSFFVSPPTSQAGALSPEEIKIRRATAAIVSNLKVEREGLSYVITVAFTGSTPEIAARVTNEITAAYLDDQVAGQFTTAERATKWLQGRLEELRIQGADQRLSVQERNAVRATYDTFLQRYTQAVQQQSLPITEARVVTAAMPGRKTAPKSMLVIAASLIAGAMAGFGIALVRDLLDRAVKSPSQLEAATGVPCFGVLPAFGISRWTKRRTAKRALQGLDPTARNFLAGAGQSIVLDAPTSQFSESLRAARVAVDTAAGGPVQVVGIVSCLAGEGRSTVAINLARLAALDGIRVLLIDADLRNPELSRGIVPTATAGLLQSLQGNREVQTVIWNDQATPLQFLPAGTDKNAAVATNALFSAGMGNTLQGLRQRYDLIIVDLPPILPVADVRAVARFFDAFLLVVEWAAITPDTLAHLFQKGQIDTKIIGTVLNKVDITKARLFG
jgi:capsular exopolysaccharide synthesis family protein